MSSERLRIGLRLHWHWLIPAVALAVLLAPLAGDRTFASDWGNHLWLVHAQGGNIGSLGLPSYYLQSSLGAFYPYYAFYGGTLYAVLGLGAWFTSANAAVILAYVLCLSASYLSWTWLAFQAGIRGWLTQIPGLLALTTPFAVTNFYGRGGIPEMIGTMAVPVIAASGIGLARAERMRVLPALAFVIGVVVLSGSHALTMVWGIAFLLACGAILVACDWRSARAHARGGLRLVWLGLLGLAINAWILVPMFLYRGRVQEGPPDALSQLEYTDPSQLFSFVRDGALLNPIIHGDINAQLPLLVLIWTVAFGVAYWSFLSRERKRLAAGLALLCGTLLLLIMTPSLIEKLPGALAYVQFPYRLLAYLDLALVGVTTLVIAAMQRARGSARLATALLALAAAAAFAASIKQNAEVRSWLPDRAAAVASTSQAPESWYAFVQFGDASAPLARPTMPGVLEVSVGEGIRDSYTVTAPPGRGGTMLTNVVTGQYFVDVTGADPVGRDEVGHMVVDLPASDRPREVTFAAHWGTGVDLGRWITLAALGISVFALSWALADRDRLVRARAYLSTARSPDD